MSFYLSDKDYKEMIGIISGNTGGKKGNDTGGTYIDMPSASTEPKQQGIVADTVDAVQMGAWKGVSDIAHGLGALTGADWLHKVGDWAGEGADENLATMSDEMKAALNQNAFDGEDQGIRNVRWWAGNLGSLIGQNLDTVLTLGAGKAATFGVKQAGKMLLKKEAAEEVGKVAVEQAAKRGIPQKYWNMVGITATMSAMSSGSRYSQKRDDVMAMTNEQLSQIPQFSDAYYEIADSEEGKGKTVEQLYDLAKVSFADKVGRDAALNPAAIATDLSTNAVSGLGGGFWGLGSPAKTIKDGLLKGAMVEGGTEAIQGVGEQYALNKAEQDNYNPNKDLTEGMADNTINGAVLGGVFGSAMGGLDTYTDRRAFNNQKRTLLNHINTGNEAIDSQLKNYVDMLNQGAADLGDLVSASRVQALNNAGIANARVRQMEEDARAQQQANAQFESDFFGEEQAAQPSEPEFTIDPQMERAVYVAKAIEKFRKGDLSGANEFISEPMVFADNQAKSQFVIGRSLDELKNIAQSYGLDPKDGKAMRQWIEDYIAKAREFNKNNQRPTHESNLQFTANVAPENRSGVISGANDEIDVGNGNYQPFQYEVVDATTLSPTQQKDDNQFRDRDRTASQSQINNIARNLDPRKLAASPTMDMGAPLLALDGKTIIAGNGRTMAIRQAYQEGGADGYRQFLKDNAGHFGVDSDQLDAVENPVLVRRLTSPVDIAQVAINSNEQGGMRMSDLEQAKVDARRLPSMDSFIAGDNGDINSPDNQQFIRQFVQNQPENLRNELLDGKGNLSQTGVQRIRNAMLYQAYGDSQTLSRLIENTDQGAKNVLNALTALAPKVAQTQQDINSGVLSDVSISNDIIQAVEKYNQLNAQGYKISDYLVQNDFVGDLSPEAREILTIFDENRRSGKRIAQVLGAYFDQAQTQGNLSQASIFGDMAFDKLGSLQQAKNVDEDIRLSLNESANSDFAKAVDDVVSGNVAQGRISMGTTPDVLKMLGIPDSKIRITGAVIQKVMGEYLGIDKGDHSHIHNLTPETLKLLPKQMNNPVAVFKSSTRKDSYVVLTELNETDSKTGKNKPVVSALHINFGKGNVEVIDVRSVYGRFDSQLTKAFRDDLLYLNKTKGQQFLKTHPLQLHWDLTSDANLSVRDIKTEADLSQYQSAKNNQESSTNQEIQRAQAIINKTFGKAAQNIEVTTFANPPKDVKNLITSDVEGWFNPKTGKITIVADSIKPTKTMTKDERLQFVVWHEMAHRGINVGYKGTYDNLMAEVGKNKAVSQIADAIQNQRKGTDDLAATSRTVAIEEAIAEIMAANETGKWNELETRYGVEIKKGQRQSAKSWLAMTAQRIKEFLSKIFGAERVTQFSDGDVLNLVANIKKSAVGNLNGNRGDVRYSTTGESLPMDLESRLARAKEQGFNTEYFYRHGTYQENPIERIRPDESFGALFTLKNDFADLRPENPAVGNRYEDFIIKGEPMTHQEFNDKLFDSVESMEEAKDLIAKDAIIDKSSLSEEEWENVLDVIAENKDLTNLIDREYDGETPEYLKEVFRFQGEDDVGYLNWGAQRLRIKLAKKYGANAIEMEDEYGISIALLPGNGIRSVEAEFNPSKTDSDNLRFSRNEDLTEERYNQAKENGETELTFHQWKQVRSPEFKAWFGDWENDPENASKVVNPKTGEPLVVYHASTASFSVFEPSNPRFAAGNINGIYFTDKIDQEMIEEYGDKIYHAFLNIKKQLTGNPRRYAENVKGVHFPYPPTTDKLNAYNKAIGSIEDIKNVILDAGFDGVKSKFGHSYEYIVFKSNQIKSATDNTGTFSKENDDIRFSRKGKSEYQRDLIVTHNISAGGIMHAHKMGGLPLASVAVAKQSNPLTNFGEVTLIGSRDYIDPKGVNKAQVFGSDIYSPRYPRISYGYSAKDQKALFNRFEKSAKEIGDSKFDYDFTQGLEDAGAKQAMLDSDAVKYQFLKEHNIPYEKAYRDIPKSVHADYPSIQKAIKAGISEEDISSIESADKFEGLFREFIKDYIKDIEGRVPPSPLLKNVIVRAKQALDGDKYTVRTFAESRVKEGLKLQESKKVLDKPETLSNMRKAVSEHSDAFRDYVDSIVETMPAKEKIWNGTDGYGRNKYVAHTIENVVKKLKKDLRGGESFNYGMPNVRAAVTPKFKSIADIQANKHRIVSKEEFETAKNTLEKEGDLLANKLGVSTLDIYDVLWNAVDENTSKAFGYAGIKDTQENRMAVDTFLNKLKALPTEYFEGKAKDITQFSNFAGAVVPDNLAKNAYDVLEKSGVKIFTYDSTDPKSRIEAIKQATNQLDEERGGDILFSRANTMQSALDLAMTGVADREPSVWDNLKSKDFSGFKERFNRAVGKVDEWLADSLRPVNDWIDSMHLEDKTGNTSSRDHEKRRLKDAMYTAKGKRDALNSELEQAYLKPILSKIAALSKETKKSKNPIDELTMKRMVGNWISAKYSIEKNLDLLRNDEKVMRNAKRLLDDARQNGTAAEVRRLNDAYLKAKEQYDNRKADIYNTDYKNKGKRFKVGVAGGWSIPEAKLTMQETLNWVKEDDLKDIAEMIYNLNQSRLEVDRASGRYTEAEYQEYKANRHYVPLTGDPNADVDVDIISGAGSNAINIARDKALDGRTISEAEDAIDAVWKSIGKSTTYAGFAEFKSRIDDLFETEVTLLKDKGYSDSQAREQATANLGISKRKMQGLTRSSDNVLIRKEGGEYYEYELPKQAMEALRNDNVEHANAFLKLISKPTGWYARGVTQWTVTFAPMNMMRDTWEKSEFIRVQKLYDKNNRLVDSKTMDKIGRATIANAFTDKEVWQATKRLGFGQELRDSVPAERMLKQLLKEGGVSNYGTYLDKSEVDLIKRLKKENNPIAGKLEKAGKILEGYNKMFDTVSALAAYKALVENGIDSKQAAATTLELTNFRKTGSKMRGIKALYMFSQPTVMGAANLIRYLSTRKGQVRFVAYLAGMTALYTVLRSMDDDDEGGNKMDQLGDITRYIPIPIGGGHYFKIPVGFGMPQMAWNFSTNIVKGAVSDISLTEAGANMLAHSLKTFAPVSPSEISAAKYPMEKLTLTATPTILQPLMQNVLNRSAFGNKITTNFVRDDKLKAEQSKATTAQFWKDVALDLNDTLGIDMHPEQIKNLFDGYSSAFGSLRELNTLFVENPNREQLGRNTRMPFVNQFIGTTNEFSIQSRYYEASEEARKVATEYESRKNRGALDGWLDDDKRKLIRFYEQDKSTTQTMRSEKANLTRALRAGQISAVAYENGIKRYNKDMSRVQAQMLRKYRMMEGLNTN